MDDVIKKIASLGLSGVILVITLASRGLAVYLAIPIAIAMFGGPFGIIGGITVIGLITLVSDALARFGIDAILSGVYAERRKNEPSASLLSEIDTLAISDDLKHKLKAEIQLYSEFKALKTSDG